MTSASIRDQLPTHRRDLWDRTWARLLAPVPAEPSDDNDHSTYDNGEKQAEQSAA